MRTFATGDRGSYVVDDLEDKYHPAVLLNFRTQKSTRVYPNTPSESNGPSADKAFAPAIKRKREGDALNKSLEKFQDARPQPGKNKKAPVEIKSRIDQDLIGSKFRLMNEFLYTTSSEKAYEHFTSHKSDFEIYHKGFQLQTQKWPEKPVELIIKDLESLAQYKNAIVCDLGCGEGFIYDHFQNAGRLLFSHDEDISEEEAARRIGQTNPKGKKNYLKKVFSFDIVAKKPFIQSCDVASLPLQKKSIDVAVFCLALMGTNYLDFLWEATRCLRKGGFLIVAEVLSRLPDLEAFNLMISCLGYELITEVKSGTFFVVLTFKKTKNKKKKKIYLEQCPELSEKLLNTKAGSSAKTLRQASKHLLNACLYKKR